VIDRRTFLAAVAASFVVPPAAAAQQGARVPRIGVLWPNPPATFESFRQGFSDLGYVEGRNISFEYRWAADKLDRLPELAADLVRLRVDVIVVLAPPAAFAAKNATQTIPIVFVAIGEPLGIGLVSNLARPGGNLTGTTRMLTEMSVKHVELLKQAVPSLSRLAVLWNPANLSHPAALKAVETTARSLSLQTRPLEVRDPAGFDGIFAAITRERADGVLLLADPLFFVHLRRITDFVASSRLPAIVNWTEFPKMGGLMGYGPSLPDEFRQAAAYVDKILKGARPGDLPVQQPTKFELVINLKTAKALGLTIPPSLLQRADEIIQ
jgi:putative ABC transport system substrate-binding protein